MRDRVVGLTVGVLMACLLTLNWYAVSGLPRELWAWMVWTGWVLGSGFAVGYFGSMLGHALADVLCDETGE